MARRSRKNNELCLHETLSQNLSKTYKAAIYIRISKEDRRLENQEQVIQAYLQAQSDIQWIKTYADNGYTGTTFKRPAFERMLEEIKKQKIDCVIVKDLSRLGRNHIETEQLIAVIFPYLGVRFIAVNDHYDSLHSRADLTVSLKNIVNEVYSNDISRKVSSIKNVQRHRGEFTGSMPPFGYKKADGEGKKLIPDERNKSVIEDIFKQKEAGRSNREIADSLNERGIASPMADYFRSGLTQKERYADCIWQAQTIRAILGNQAYIGNMVQGKKKRYRLNGTIKVQNTAAKDYVSIEQTHAAIIPQSLFERVQSICEAESQRHREAKVKYRHLKSTEDLLKDKIFTMEGRKMYRQRKILQQSDMLYYYVLPSGSRNHGALYDSYYMSENKITAVLNRVILLYIKLLSPSFRTELAGSEQDKNLKIRGSDQGSRKWPGASQKRTALLAKKYKDMIEQVITQEEYMEWKHSFDKSEIQMDQQKRRVDEAEEIQPGQGKLRPEWINLLIQRVVITKNRTIGLAFCIIDEFAGTEREEQHRPCRQK